MERQVRAEAGAWGVMRSIHDAFIQPLLIATGAGQLLLGVYISGSSLLNFGAGWLGPPLAGSVGSLVKMTVACLAFGRLALLAFAVYLAVADDPSPGVLIVLILAWSLGEGLAFPLWTSFIAGLADAGERGRWMAFRATSATLFTIPVMIAVTTVVLVASRERALPFAYGGAAIAAATSLALLVKMFRAARHDAPPPKRALTSMPTSPESRRFLSGVLVFWFGAGLTWPILPRYITTELGAPTAYFAATQVLAGFVGVVVAPRWGRLGDRSGAVRILLLCGIGSAVIPILWALTPIYWLGFAIDVLAFSVWPGHLLGLTLRGVELAESDADRPMLLGWTNLAQGAGACLSPLIASSIVGITGVAAVLGLSAALRLLGTLMIAGYRLPGQRPRP